VTRGHLLDTSMLLALGLDDHLQNRKALGKQDVVRAANRIDGVIM